MKADSSTFPLYPDMETLDSWQNWLFTFGYLAFTMFVIWQVIKPSR